MAEIMAREDVVLQRIHVILVKETVMDLMMEVNMMVMKGARETWCAAATIVRSLDIISTPRMIVVREPGDT